MSAMQAAVAALGGVLDDPYEPFMSSVAVAVASDNM